MAVCWAAVLPAAQAHAGPLTKARFLHAVPGAAPAVLIVHGHPPRLPSSYGKPSPYHACHPGPARLELKVKGQKQAAATANIDIGRGRYTVIAVPEGKGVGLRVYKDGTAVPGKARMRTINAAAELDKADMRVDGKEVARIRPAEATSYTSVPPGRHDLSVTRMGGAGGALATATGVPLVAGTASSAIVVGSRGMPTQVLLVSDQTAGSSVAPATGFGGAVDDGSAWLLVLLAAFVAGSLGGTAYLLTAGRRSAPALIAGPTFGGVPETRAAPPPSTAVRPEARRGPPAAPSRERAWMVAAGAALTAGSLGRLLYKAGRRRRRGA